MFEYAIKILKEELKYHKKLDNINFLSQDGVNSMDELEQAIEVLKKAGEK